MSATTTGARGAIWRVLAIPWLALGLAVASGASASGSAVGGEPDRRPRVHDEHSAGRVGPLALAAAASPSSGCDPDDRPGGSEGPDDDGDECNFTVHGEIPYRPATGSDSDTATWTPSLPPCSPTKRQAYAAAIHAAADNFPQDAQLMTEAWFAGTGITYAFDHSSGIGRELLANGAFQELNRSVQSYVKGRLDQGETDVTVPAPPLKLFAFTNPVTTPALFWAFRGTQGLSVKGGGFETSTGYRGSLTYVISDTAGFKGNDKTSIGPVISMAHYLQTVCGQPKYKDGPRPLKTTLTVQVDFSG
jgi:hypothetical protein